MFSSLTLRQKFGLLALAYLVAILVNLALSTVAVLRVFQPALRDAWSALTQEQIIEQIRGQLDREDVLLRQASSPVELQREWRTTERFWANRRAALESFMNEPDLRDLWNAIERLFLARIAEGEALARLDAEPEAFPRWVERMRETVSELDRLWIQAGERLAGKRALALHRAEQAHTWIINLMVITTGLGVVVCAVGLLMVRRWMAGPVDQLREATEQFALGNLSYRIPPLPRDELGLIARELNLMAERISHLERTLIEDARAQTVARLVHQLQERVRPGLEAIRTELTQSIPEMEDQPDLMLSNRNMLETIEHFERWFDDLARMLSPSSPMFAQLDPGDMIRHVVTGLGTVLDRREVEVRVSIDPDLGVVEGDRVQLEHALLALVTNALEASRPGQQVEASARSVPDDPSFWELVVADQGKGIPPEMLDIVCAPFFSTKAEGDGVGLALSRAVARAHGGDLFLSSSLNRGTSARLRLLKRRQQPVEPTPGPS